VLKKHLVKKEARLLVSMTCDGELVVAVFRGPRVESIEILHKLSDVLSMPELGEVKYCGFIDSKEAENLINLLQLYNVCRLVVKVRDWQKDFMTNFCNEYTRFKRKIGSYRQIEQC